MTLALFDFDGTITKSDSFFRFIRFVVGNTRSVIGGIVLSPILLVYKLKLMPNYKAKQKVISWFFKGMSEETFLAMARDFSLVHIDEIIRDDAMKKIAWHKRQGHKVIVVSASLECWLLPWTQKHGLELLATKLEIKNNEVTGKLLGKNCYGQEKVNRIKEVYDIKKYDYIYAYGDSRGDKEMLSLANESFYKLMN